MRRQLDLCALLHAYTMPGGVCGRRDTNSGRGRGCSRVGAVVGTGLAVVSGAAGWGTAHRLLAGLALPPLTALAVLTWIAARRLFATAIAALALFGLAAALTGETVHLAVASAAFAATALLGWRVFADFRPLRADAPAQEPGAHPRSPATT